MKNSLKTISSIALLLAAGQASSLNIKQGHFLFEMGAFSANQVESQNIYIQGLVGDRFNTTGGSNANALFGLGYLVDGFEKERFGLDYGVNVFYLNNTKVFGTINQELMFTNLGYSYEIKHLPIYAAAKAHLKTSSNKVAVTVDAGIGPNFMATSNYKDWSIDGGMTLPDNAFFGRSNVTFSAMAGVGLKFTPSEGHAPIECGYRFFYLGESTFYARTNQIINTLRTGNNYAQALVCTLTA